MSQLSGESYVTSKQKRALDIIGSTLALGALAVPLGLLTVGAAIDSRSMPFMRQQRRSRNGRMFDVFKVRTMREPQAEDPNIWRRYSTYGKVVRKMGLDEIPQFFNVVRGDMSLIGPRPLLDKDLEKREALDPLLFKDWYFWYQRGRPGLTGPAQLYLHRYHAPESQNFVEGMRRDVGYMEKATLIGDIALLAETGLAPLTRWRSEVIDLTEAISSQSTADIAQPAAQPVNYRI